MRINHPRLEIDDLAAVIGESIAAQQTAQQNDHAPKPVSSGAQTVSPASSPPHVKLQPDFQPRPDHRYHVNELLQYHDRVFVQAAYRAVLKRSPNEAELLRELKRLRSGDVNKIDLLATLRFSPEGRAKQVQLDGLVWPALVRRLGQLPLLGYLIRLGIAFVRLPNQVRDQREFGSYVLAQNEQIADFINLTADRLTERLNTSASEQQTIAQRQGDTEQQQRDTEQRQRDTEQRQRDIQIRQENFERVAGASFDDVKQRIDDSRTDSAQQLEALRFRIGDVTNHDLNVLYGELEDRFRGGREDIKQGFREYLPYVKDSAPVLDLGSGRGEWLELLKENAIEARGVDSNGLQIEQCRARGLDVTEQDLFVYLQSTAAESTGAVTGFHIIEHLSFNALIALLNEVMRVLRPGGVVIFETPNPNNVVVGSNYFYLDPTHRHPLPTELMEFVFKNRGFEQIEILPLHPWHSGRVAGEGELAERFNGYFYGPMDYAIVGRKVTP